MSRTLWEIFADEDHALVFCSTCDWGYAAEDERAALDARAEHARKHEGKDQS